MKTARREPDATAGADAEGETPRSRSADRSLLSRLWYRIVQFSVASLLSATGGLRSSGRTNIPATGGVLLVSNHLSYLDVFVLGILVPRPLNYVARSTLFLPLLGSLIRSVGGFPIQREGMGASGLKETLRRLRNGGIVVLFPEGTRSTSGVLGAMKPGIAVLAMRARVPVVPAAVAGTMEAWPRWRPFPWVYPIRIHYGPAILPQEIADLAPEAVVALIRARILDCQRVAQEGLRRDLGRRPAQPTPGSPRTPAAAD